MKLTGELKKQVEKTDNMDEKKSLIENAGMLLDDDELEQVSGGKSGKLDLWSLPPGTIKVYNEKEFDNVSKPLKRCPNPNCNADKSRFEDRYFYFVNTNELFQGQECQDCRKRWVCKLLY